MNLPWFIENPDSNIYLSNNYVVLDFECTNIEHGSAYAEQNRLLLACWVLGEGHPDAGQSPEVQHCWGSEFEPSGLLAAIGRADYMVAHFSKFELGWLERCGVDLRSVLPYCTQIGEYVIAGNRKFPGGLGLEASCQRYGISGKRSFISALMEAGVCPSEMPTKALQEYCENDVEVTEQLFLRQRLLLQDGKLLPVAYARNLLTPVLVDIEPRGMCLDSGRVKETHADYSTRYAALLKEFETLTGGINPKSGKQMREYLYTKLAFEEATDHRGTPMRTKGGKKGEPQARTDKKVLPLLKATTDDQKEFKKLAIEIAKLKVPVQNLVKMKAITERGENLVYASINQTITDTHRLSSSGRRGGFQFHNFDRAFKPLFRARRDDYRVVEADAPQLEFRVAAHCGDDQAAKRDIETGADIHAFTASILGTSRQDAKSHTFKPLYGGQSGTKREKAYYAAFREKYSALYKEQTRWTWEVLNKKQLRIASGLIFYWPDTEISRSGYISNTSSIFNYPVQSFATADIIPLTLVLLWHSIAGMSAFLVNTIHDSVVLESPECEVDRLVDCVVACFTRDIYGLLEKLYKVKFSVPLGVSVKVGTSWGDGEEQKHNGAAPQRTE